MFLTPRFGMQLGVDFKFLPNFDWVSASAGQTMTRVVVGGVVSLGKK